MRKAPKSEQEKLEVEAAGRTDSRKSGFKMMDLRDSGAVRLSNGVYMHWHVPPKDRSPGLAYLNVPDASFVLEFGKKKLVFDGEEFRRWLRWV